MPGPHHDHQHSETLIESRIATGAATASGRERLASKAFVALADTLVEGYYVIDLLDRLVEYSVGLLAADAAAIMLADASGQLRAVAASREDADLMDLLQLQTGQGPSVDCYTTGAAVNVTDLDEAAHRWPVFIAALERQGTIRSVHALPLQLRGQSIGAMNLFHRHPGALPADDLALGQALADVATIGILSERSARTSEVLAEQLQTALDSRIVIEQAKGIIAQHLGIGLGEAFQLLRQYVRARSMRLNETAHLFTTGALDPRVLITSAAAPKRHPRTRNRP